MKISITKLSLALACAFSAMAFAAPSPEEIKQLGTNLTPWGAEIAGNKEGTIPAYTGGTKAPAGFNEKSGKWPDPFPNDKPLYSINKSNVAKYSAVLPAGTAELINLYDTFRVDVYPTRRSFWQSKAADEGTIKNAKNPDCKLTNNGDTMVGCWAGVPFPLPKNANEVIWNFNVRQIQPGILKTENWLVNTSGKPTFILWADVDVDYTYWRTDLKPYEGVAKYSRRFVSTTQAPARDYGNVNTNWYPLDYIGNSQKTWAYTPGQRRVRVAPEFSYDTPIAQLGAVISFDEVAMFSGRADRHDYKLLGKKEVIIPYNGYRWANVTKPEEMMLAKHANPDFARFELRRAWVIEATVKPGVRHVAAKRTFYVDADSYTIMQVDTVDASGKLSKVIYANGAPNYADGGWLDFNSALHAYDLNKSQYLVMGFMGKPNLGIFNHHAPLVSETDLSPEGMAAKGIR